MFYPPPPNPPPPIAKKLAERQRIDTEVRAASAALDVAESAVVTAEAADTAAHVAAVREGKPDPGTPAADKANAEAEDARRRLHAATVALGQIDSEYLDTAKRNVTAWRRTAEQNLAEATTELRAAVELTQTALDKACAAIGTGWYLDAVEQDKPARYRPSLPRSTTLGQNGDPLPLSIHPDALLEWADRVTAPPAEPPDRSQPAAMTTTIAGCQLEPHASGVRRRENTPV